MNNKRGSMVLVIVLILALALGAIAGGFGVTALRNRQIYTQKIEAGDRYLSIGDYDNAVLMYQEAIRKDDRNDEGYLKLANAYVEQGYISMAIGALETGYNKTNSERIWDMLVAYRDLESGNGGSGKEPTLNKSLLNKIEGSTYGDYVKKNEVESVSTGASGEAIVRIKGIPADLIYRNMDLLPAVVVNGQVQAGAYPTEVIFDNLTGLFGTSGTMSLEQFKTLEFNDISIIEGGGTGYQLRLIYLGSTLLLPCDREGNVNMDESCVFEPQSSGTKKDEKKEEEEGSGTKLVGTVEDSQTGYGIPYARLKFYDGSVIADEPVAEVETDDSGYYEVKLQDGNYTAVISKEGYVEIEKYIQVGTYSDEQDMDFVLSEESAGEIRIVLEWDSPECDLDSYLVGDNGWLKFSNRELYADGKVAASLDRDSRSGHGVETTTVYDMKGSYAFHVFDYNGSGGMQESGATVTIYAPGESPQVVSIPSDAGNCWYVCEINAGKVSITNYMAEESATYSPK